MKFYQLEKGERFMLVHSDSNVVLTKVNKSEAELKNWPKLIKINSQTSVLRVGKSK